MDEWTEIRKRVLLGGESKRAILRETGMHWLTLEKIFDAVCAGANGYLLKTASTEQVLSAIRQAASGGAPMDPDVAERVLQPFNQLAQDKPTQSEDYGLSDREKQILEQMAQGLVNKEIAEVLDISPHTVVNHMRSIYSRTGSVR